MKNLRFKKLWIMSDQQKRAVKFEFANRFNLILAKEKNSVGKSSVVKSIFWCMGCEPRFDENWLGLSCKVVLQFQVENKPYWMARHQDRVLFSEDGKKFTSYTHITTDFAPVFAKLVDFHVLLKKRDADEVIHPPPAYYFLPYYIDQKISWSQAWNSFDRLTQFSNWSKEIISSHVGIYKQEYFDKTEELFESIRQVSLEDQEIERVETTGSVVRELFPDVEMITSTDEFDEIYSEITDDMFELHESQEGLVEKIADYRAEKAVLENQISLARSAMFEADKDYEFSEAAPEELECPTCGTVHDNTLVERFTLLQDRDAARDIFKNLSTRLEAIEPQLNEKEGEFVAVKEKISSLEKKYYKQDSGANVTMQNVLDGISAKKVENRVKKAKAERVERRSSFLEKRDKIKSERAESTKENRKVVASAFSELFASYTARLKAFGVNSEKIKSPEHHKKVAKSGGAAESTRAMLAYYMSIYKLIAEFGEEVLSPLVIDTPNQHEQAAEHYENIVKLILDELPEDSQLFLCGMDSKYLKPLLQEGRSWYLDHEHALLQKEHYDEVRNEISPVFETAWEEA